jgi:3-oxoacyl-[acyl-carrier protein] reductase
MRNIIIVGASSGIGKNLAQKINNSCNLYTFSRNESIGNWTNWSVGEKLDISNLPEVIDGFVYCPGTINLKPFSNIKKEDFYQDFEINVMGAIYFLKEIYPLLKKSENASVVLFSSVAASKGMSFHASISTSKGAIEGLTKSLAAEWAPIIRVNAVAPSLVATELSAKIIKNEKTLETTVQKHPMKRIGKPEDISSMVEFLLGNESSWITGQILHVDGGMSL